MSGVTWTTWNRLEANLNSQSMSKATWYRLTKKVWKAIEAVRDDRERAYIEELLTANQPIVVVADGAWSHRGFTAGQHNWVLLNADTTFKTLGVIDTNVSVEESQRGRKKKRGKGEKTEGKGDVLEYWSVSHSTFRLRPAENGKVTVKE